MDAAAAHPECALLQAYAAALYLYALSSSDAAKARPLLERARASFDSLSERERFFIDAIVAGCAGDFGRALTLYQDLTATL